ncbi:MFS transporter [Nocardioides sp. W7]|uniref:MFS transporter n=1 Tax=Nocardioides sp. W7 TaxID=2931390 RepID=UPI001FD25DA5|nr:MFS transporter [Nocardioides sp. W7]
MTRRLTFVTLVLITTVTAVVSSLGAPLVPEIAADLDVPLEDAQWTLTATLVAGAVSTPVVGRFGSGRLRRPTILAGLLAVSAGTTLAALPFGLPSLLVGRTLQGVGLALVPLAFAVARDVWSGHRLPAVLAFLSVSTVAGAGLGYPLTALVAQSWGLAAAYWLGTALTAVTVLMAWAFVPRTEGEEPSPVDWPAAALVGLGLVGVLLAVSRGETWGWTSGRTTAAAAAGVLLLAAWVRRTLRSTHPLVDLRLAVRPGLAGPNLVAFVAGVGMYSLLTLVIVIVQSDVPGWGLGAPVTVAGLILVPYSVMSVAGSRLAQAVGRRFGDAVLLPTGCLVFLAATVLLAFEHDHLWQVLACMAVGGLGSGFTFSSLAALMVPHVPRAETGSAMAFNQVLRYVGFSVGSASSVALMTVYGGGPGEVGFRGALLTVAGVWVVAAAAATVLARRA